MEECADILIEAIEVFINQILYMRDVYPQQIFKKRRIYNTPIYASIFPPLNSYIHNVLKSARELLTLSRNDEVSDLRRVEVVLYTDENHIFEKHIFELFDLTKLQVKLDDQFLLEFEETLRKSLYQLSERMKVLHKLPSDTKMAIRLHTTQSGHIAISNKTEFQDFPWLIADAVATDGDKKRWYLLPLATVHTLGMNVLTETC